MAEPALIIGLGNEMRGDDGAGLLVADLLRGIGLAAVRCEGEPVAVLDLWEGHEEVVVVDAVPGSEPGRIWRLQRGDAELPVLLDRRASTHLLGLGDVLVLAAQLGRAPAALSVIGIEGSCFALGSKPSAAVAAAARSVADELAGAPVLEPAGKDS